MHSASRQNSETMSEELGAELTAAPARRRTPSLVSFTPGLPVSEEFTAYWLSQATLRLRRELCWLWAGNVRTAWEPGGPLTDGVSEVLQRNHREPQKQEFFLTDETARYLTDEICLPVPLPRESPPLGSFEWLARELQLEPAEVFCVALVLAAARDEATAEVVAALHGGGRLTFVTLGLVQRLWDEPAAISALNSASHPLFRTGILRPLETSVSLDWRTPLMIPPMVAGALEQHDAVPHGLEQLRSAASDPMTLAGEEVPAQLAMLAVRMQQRPAETTLVTLRRALTSESVSGQRIRAMLTDLAQLSGRGLYMLAPSAQNLSPGDLQSLATVCWLRNADLLMPSAPGPAPLHDGAVPFHLPFSGVPIHVFVPAEESTVRANCPVLPPLEIAAFDYEQRLKCWQDALSGIPGVSPEMVQQCAFRFRIGSSTIEEVASSLRRSRKPVTAEQLCTACLQQVQLDFGSLARRVSPRFDGHELVLPPDQHRQFEELVGAMRSLSEVHARWGTGKVWQECGISALFAGPSGTGKTMAAEVLSARLKLPMYHIDLSQVVNKYIGETEKNLRRLFDAAEQADVLLFFDEADALFGQRTQVKTAHDRYANLEVSYLLQRMESFRGLAILATNRRKDLDDAFLRRLRFIIEFPSPEQAERRRIWEQCIPLRVDASDLDLEFLSRQFAVTGGHIRSIVLYACLQAAATASSESTPTLTMPAVMLAVQREYQKLGRVVTREQFGPWQHCVSWTDR